MGIGRHQQARPDLHQQQSPETEPSRSSASQSTSTELLSTKMRAKNTLVKSPRLCCACDSSYGLVCEDSHNNDSTELMQKIQFGCLSPQGGSNKPAHGQS